MQSVCHHLTPNSAQNLSRRCRQNLNDLEDGGVCCGSAGREKVPAAGPVTNWAASHQTCEGSLEIFCHFFSMLFSSHPTPSLYLPLSSSHLCFNLLEIKRGHVYLIVTSSEAELGCTGLLAPVRDKISAGQQTYRTASSKGRHLSSERVRQETSGGGELLVGAAPTTPC